MSICLPSHLSFVDDKAPRLLTYFTTPESAGTYLSPIDRGKSIKVFSDFYKANYDNQTTYHSLSQKFILNLFETALPN